MSQFFTLEYHLTVTVLWMAAYLGYRAVLTRTDDFAAQRAYLLCTVLLVPLYPVWALMIPAPEALHLSAYMPELSLTPAAPTVANSSGVHSAIPQITIAEIASCIYFIIASLFILRLLWRLWNFRSYERFSAACRRAQWSAASYFEWIYIDESLPKEQQDIMHLHESAHARLGHSGDKLAMSIVSSIFWYQPLLYKIRQSLDTVHEYQADARVLHSQIDKKSYAELLISTSESKDFLPLALSFHQSIHKRLIMMYQRQTPVFLKTLFSVVLLAVGIYAAGSFIASCSTDEQDEIEETPATQGVADRSQDEVYKRTDEMPMLLKAYNGPGAPTPEEQQLSQTMLLDFIYANIKYPESTRASGKEGLSVVQMIIEKSGEITNVRVVKSLDSDTDDELYRVFDQMSADPDMKWRPGMQGGNAHRVEYTIPIRWRLTGDDKVISAPVSH